MRKDEITEQVAHSLGLLGIPFDTREGGLRFDRARDGLRWACAFSFQEDYAHLFGRLPFGVAAERALGELNRLNAGLADGCFFLRDGEVLLRQTLFLPDAYAVGRAMEGALSRQVHYMLRARDALMGFSI